MLYDHDYDDDNDIDALSLEVTLPILQPFSALITKPIMHQTTQ